MGDILIIFHPGRDNLEDIAMVEIIWTTVVQQTIPPTKLVLKARSKSRQVEIICTLRTSHVENVTDILSRKPEGFSIVFKLTNAGKRPSTTAVVSKKCPSGTVYDTNLKFCREGYIIASSTGQQTNEFLILLWLRQPRGEINSKLDTDLISALASQFSLQAKQISRITFHKQNAANIFIVCTFRLTLTPFQSLIMDNQHTTNLNITRENSAFLELLNFTQNFTVTWKNYSFYVVSVISKRLSCYGGTKLQSHEYNIVNKTGELVVKTGEAFSFNDYALLIVDGNNTLCRKLVLSDCREGAYVHDH
jgi:hypothetical protein